MSIYPIWQAIAKTINECNCEVISETTRKDQFDSFEQLFNDSNNSYRVLISELSTLDTIYIAWKHKQSSQNGTVTLKSSFLDGFIFELYYVSNDMPKYERDRLCERLYDVLNPWLDTEIAYTSRTNYHVLK